MESGLRQRAHRLRAGIKRLEQNRRRLTETRRVLHPHPSLGDHAEDALGADQHPVGTRPGARPGQPPALPPAARCQRAQRLDEVVDVRVQGRVVATGAGGDPATQCRVLKRLREVPQREAVLAQLLLEARARGARLDQGRARRGIHLQHTVHRLQINGHGRGIRRRLHPADDARAAAERDRRSASLLAPRENTFELALVRGMRHGIRRIVELPTKRPHDVAIRLPVRVRGALIGIAPAESGERAGRLEPRGRKLDVLQASRALHLGRAEAEVLARSAGHRLHLLVRRLLVLEAPAPELATARHRRGAYGSTRSRSARAEPPCASISTRSAATGSKPSSRP